MVNNNLPAGNFWRAVEIYLRIAYTTTEPPKAVRDSIAALRQASESDLYDHSAFERDKTQPDGRLSLRLGNQAYPHMKFVIEHAPDGIWSLLRADTHDCHIMPATTSPAYAGFRKLMEQNAAIATRIEAEWTEAGLPTFKKFLRDDLARRAARH